MIESEERQLLVTNAAGTTIVNLDNERRDTSSLIRQNESPESISNDGEFEELLRRAQIEDLSRVEDLGFMYQSGFDKCGRPVIVFIGKWFRQGDIDLEKAILFILKVVDPVSRGDYVVIYFHSKTTRDNIPSYTWIKAIYNVLNYRYKKNLKAFYIVHPTMWTKLTCWWFSTFMASAIKNKITNVHALTELGSEMDTKDLNLPMFITEHDMTLNGLRFYQP